MGRIIDADGHVHTTPVLDQFISLIERPYRDRVRKSPDDPFVPLIDGRPWPAPMVRKDPPLFIRGKEPLLRWHEKPERCGMWDPHRRVKDMDLDGIDVAVLFDTVIGLAAYGHSDPGMAGALCRAYNNWLAAYCRPYPNRLKGVAAIPIGDPRAAAEELRRAVKELGFVAGLMPNWPGTFRRNLHDPMYEPLWDEAQRLDVAVCIHNNALFGLAFEDRFHSYMYAKPNHDPMENMIAVQCLIFGGVLDRFPKLRFAFMEGGAGWVPFWIDRLGEYYEEFLEGKFARGAPEEYFKSDQCYFSCEPEEKTIGYVAETIGADRLIYASDYYHHDAIFPGSVKAISGRKNLPAKVKAKVLGESAEVLYRLGGK